jgi:hypothetical protein
MLGSDHFDLLRMNGKLKDEVSVANQISIAVLILHMTNIEFR